MASQTSNWKHYVSSTLQSTTRSSQPRTRQPLGPAALLPTPTRASSYPTNMSTPSYHAKGKMTPVSQYTKSLYSPSPTPPSMTTKPSPSPATPSTVGSNASPIKLAGIQPPAPFTGPYPIGYTNKEPVPSDDNDGGDDASDLKRPNRQGAASCNPWDYVLVESETGKDGEEGKGKVRRRFTKRELEALEVLWSISKSPTKYQRQRLGAWLGV